MSPATGPTSGEVMRRLDEVVTELRRLGDTLEAGYVRKDVYASDRQADALQIKGLEDEHRLITRRIDKIEETGSTNRRLIITAFIAPIIVGVVVVLLLAALGVSK